MDPLIYGKVMLVGLLLIGAASIVAPDWTELFIAGLIAALVGVYVYEQGRMKGRWDEHQSKDDEESR